MVRVSVVFTGSVLRARRVIPPRAFRVVVWLVDQFVCLRVGQISLEISSLRASYYYGSGFWFLVSKYITIMCVRVYYYIIVIVNIILRFV